MNVQVVLIQSVQISYLFLDPHWLTAQIKLISL